MSWLKQWEPENPQFWKDQGSGLAWRTMWITTFTLIFSFATWFVMSAVAVRLPAIGFQFDQMQLFWLAAMPGLSGGTFRIIHAFIIPIFGTRLTITVATFLKIIPMVWLGFAILDPATPYWQFMIISILCGFGGGDFSSYMPSTSLFFPKRLQGVSLGIQAGIGNFGVSLTQFVTPWIIMFPLIAALGSPQIFTKPGNIEIKKENAIVKQINIKDPAWKKLIEVKDDGKGNITDVVKKDNSEDAKKLQLVVKKNEAGNVTDVRVGANMWLQNSAFWYIPVLIFAGLICLIWLRSVPVKASIKEQLDIFGKKNRAGRHTLYCTITYVMTFGSFAGFSAAFPLMIKAIYGNIPGIVGPDPLKYSFLGPLVGAVIRALTGPIFDKIGGSIGIMISGVGMILGCAALLFGGYLTPINLDPFNGFVGIMLWIFLMSGIGNAATFRQYPIVFAYSPRQGAGVVGWTAAIAAYGPFIFSSLIGGSIATFKTGSIRGAMPFFIGVAIYYVIATLINWFVYTKPGAERGDWGNKWGTWWDKAKSTWPTN